MTDWIDRHRWIVLALLSAGLFAAAIVRAFAKPFWHDEIYTILLAETGSPRLIWAAFRDGADQMPPLTSWLTAAIHRVAGTGPLVTRLPALIGFWIATLALFAIVRRRTNVLLGIVAALLLFWTAAFRYSIEARGYGLTLACAGLALYAWGEAASPRARARHRWLLGGALAAGVWTHDYAVLLFLPVVAGEAVRQLRQRQLDARTWAAIAAAAAVCTPLALVRIAAAADAGTFWARGEPETLAGLYRFLLNRLMTTYVGVALVAALAAAVVVRSIEALRHSAADRGTPLPLHERIAGVVALALPAVALPIAELAGTGLVARYVLFALVPIAAAVPIAIGRLAPRHTLLHAALCACLVVAFGKEVADTFTPGRLAFRNPALAHPLLRAALDQSDAVAVTGGIWHLQLWYYSPPEERARIVYLVDPDSAARILGTDTVDRNFLRLSRYVPIGVQDYGEFTADRRTFLVLEYGRGWLLQRIEEDGGELSVVQMGPGRLLAARLPR